MRHLDLFSGIGGFALAAQRMGWKTVAFCDNDPWAQKHLDKHWPEVPCYGDVKTLKGEQVGTVDIITGGFPCQDISSAGRGKGLAGERSGLWSEFHRLIGELKPRWVVIENVEALRRRGLGIVLGQLAALGYDAEWHCIPAAAVGAPQERDRIWVIAHTKCLRLSGQGQLVTSLHPTPSAFKEADRLKHAVQQRCLPFVCGGHDGVPTWVDEFAVHALGNALAPEIPHQIFQAIDLAAQQANKEGEK